MSSATGHLIGDFLFGLCAYCTPSQLATLCAREKSPRTKTLQNYGDRDLLLASECPMCCVQSLAGQHAVTRVARASVDYFESRPATREVVVFLVATLVNQRWRGDDRCTPERSVVSTTALSKHRYRVPCWC